MPSQVPLEDYLSSRRKKIHDSLRSLVPLKSNSPHSVLFEAASYSLLAPGKRLRPLLTLATTQLLNGNEEIALYPACALEMIHTYSLIHDDLPCMDDDDLRRGRPTLHKAYDEGMATLAGDYLLTYAFEVLTLSPQLTDSQKLNLIQTLANRSGSEGMIGGQVADILAENTSITPELLEWIHRHKTGALICASVEFGGIVAQASPETMILLTQFGEMIGLAFQIIDDILDVEGETQTLGKTTGSDEKQHKSTFVSLHGMDEAKRISSELLLQSSSLLSCHFLPNSYLDQITQFIGSRNH